MYHCHVLCHIPFLPLAASACPQPKFMTHSMKLILFVSQYLQLEEDPPPMSKKPRPDQSSNSATPSTNSKTADSSYISTTKSKRKKSKKKSSQTSNTTASSALPSDFFDSGVSKTFHGHGEEVYYESSSESEGEGERETAGSGGSRVQATPPGVPPG